MPVPDDMLLGDATPCHKKGRDPERYVMYRIIVVFPAEYKIFATIFLVRVDSECAGYIRDWQGAFTAGRGTADNQYVAKGLYRVVIERGERALGVHIDYSSAFDSSSHIYLFNALKAAGASGKTLQLFKAIYSQARVRAKVGDAVSTPLRVGRGVLEGDVPSPKIFNIGLEIY